MTLNEPGEILFSGVSGPLQLLEDRFTLEEDNGCTHFEYESTIGVRGWIFGWAIARFYAKSIVERMMLTHVPEMKAAVEDRARRSRVYPRSGCALAADAGVTQADAVATTSP